MVTHGNLINSTAARHEFYNENVGSFLLLSSFSFDSSIAGIFWTLCSGGKLVLPPMRIEQDVHQLAKIISDQEVTHTLCLPSLYMILLDLADTSLLSSLQTIIVAGEACQRELVSRHYNALPQTALYNEYGPTETTVWSTAYRVPSEYAGNKVPIGRPIPNVQNYILDRNRKPVPIGVPGELCIGGAGVTPGYLNDPQNTALKFIELSLNGEPVQRIYQTGDRARYLPDGNIEFLGRTDQQVKIRGNRVELEEIESVLRGIPGVEDAVVVLRNDRLAAFIITGPDSETTPDWRGYLTTYLADFMIPESFTILEEFPRTPNGKIDRKALPDPEIDFRDRGYIAPRSATEKLLADIWMDVLDVDQVGVEDNFFEIGGNSLLSIRIFSRITDQFDVKLPLSVLFTEFTLERLAAKIDKEKEGGEDWSLIVPIQPEGEKTPFFCIHGLTGDILWFRQLGQLMAPDQPFYGIQARGLDGKTPAIDNISEMAGTYLAEIKQIQPTGPYILGGASLGGTVALEMAQQLETRGEEVALLTMFDHAPDSVDENYAGRKSIPAKGIHLLTNSIRWAQSMRELGSGPLVQRFVRKARIGLKKFNGRPQDDSKSVDAADLLDYGGDLPDFRKRMIETHWHAINNYTASAYQKPVLLLQAKSQPLLSTRKSEDTWVHLATGQLTVINIPGSHEGMFHEPHVQTLARELRSQLARVQTLEA
jgi:thioesterase domain-containing protein/acyl carrier protein